MSDLSKTTLKHLRDRAIVLDALIDALAAQVRTTEYRLTVDDSIELINVMNVLLVDIKHHVDSNYHKIMNDGGK